MKPNHGSNSPKILILVPSYQRPLLAMRLCRSAGETMQGIRTEFVVAVHNNDPEILQYRRLIGDIPCVRELFIIQEPTRPGMVDPLNQMAAKYASGADILGFIGDDVIPRTPGWDLKLAAPLRRRIGISYGNDKIHGAMLPTAVMMSAHIVRKLGHMAPPQLQHLFVDNAWRAWGEAINRLSYMEHVVLEHMHPLAGKGEQDATYGVQDNTLDAMNWNIYQHNWLKEDIRKLRELVR